jgi:hypothetical protein
MQRSARLRPGARPCFGSAGAGVRTVTLQATEPLGGVIAVAYVGEAVRYPIALNGVPLGASGMYTLQHTDRIDIAADSYWVSKNLSPLRVAFDPDQHEPNTRCCMTKARLEIGQDVVICPGCAGTPCNVVYKAAAWDAMLQSNPDMKCPSCGFRPSQPPWRPPSPRRKRSPLHELSRFVPK